MSKKYWLDQPGNVRWLWRLFLAMLAATILVEPFIELHPHFAIENSFGFYAWFSVLSCVVMITVAKGLAWLLARADSYYEDSDESARHD